MNIIKTNSVNGLSHFKIDINSKLLENLSLYNSISSFFEDLLENRKYFVILRLEYLETGNFVSLHHGLIISKSQLDAYFKYCKDILSLKSNDYRDKAFSSIIFDYLLIDKKDEKHFIKKWTVLNIESPKPIKLESFSNSIITVTLPMNRDYLSWGNIMHNSPTIKIITTQIYTYKIKLTKKYTLVDIIKDGNKIFTFTDLDFKKDLFIRKCGLQKKKYIFFFKLQLLY